MTYDGAYVEGSGRATEPILWLCKCGARMAFFLKRCQACRRDKPKP